MAQTMTMPYNRDAEMALLGCMLIDNEIAVDIIERLKEDDFYVDAHKLILGAMKKVYSFRKPIDLVTLYDELEAEGALEKIGGMPYLTELSEVMPSSANYLSYYEIVTRDSTNRQLIRASRKIIENCMSNPERESSVDFAEKNVYDISRETDTSDLKGMPEEDVVEKVIEKFEILQANPDAFRGVPTGFKMLDKLTNGLQPSDLIVLAARPGCGKTSFAMNIVENAAVNHKLVCAVFSLEMPRIQIVQRLMCSLARVSMSKALAGKLNTNEWKLLMRAGDRLKESQIYIDDSSRTTVQTVNSRCKRLKARLGRLDFIMVDYIQLMSGGSVKKGGPENRQQEIASITRDLKIMAKELNVPVLALSQLRRIDKSQEAQLSDLRESGAIEQDADIVMFINRLDDQKSKDEKGENTEEKKRPVGSTEINVAKHRNGAPGRVLLRFIGDQTRFVDMDDVNREIEPPDLKKDPDPEAIEEDASDLFPTGNESSGEDE